MRVLYSLLKLKLEYLASEEYNLNLSDDIKKNHRVDLCDCQLFRLIRIIEESDVDSEKLIELINKKNKIKNKIDKTIDEYIDLQNSIKDIQFMDKIIFIEIPAYGDRKEINKQITKVYKDGVIINSHNFVRWGKSASMTRHGIIAFVREDIKDRLNEKAMMDIKVGKVIIAKWEAYFNLLLSSCEFVKKEHIPNIIVVKDYIFPLPKQKVQFVIEKELIDKDGNPIMKDKKKTDEEDLKKEPIVYKDIEIIEKDDLKANAFDGCGICMPYVSEWFQKDLDLDYRPCAWIIRLPYVKGLLIEMDFYKYAEQEKCYIITDYWNKDHDIREEKIDAILTESQFKAIKHFDDWNDYMKKFHKHNHKMGITRYNKNPKSESNMTRYNFQYLQTLDLGDKIIDLAQYSIDWLDKVIKGDKLSTLLFLGTSLNEEIETEDIQHEINNIYSTSNKYIQAILLNDKMLKDVHIQNEFVFNMIKKYINDMKFGKIWLEGRYEFIYPDMFAFLQYIFNQKVVGLLKEKEHWSYGKKGDSVGTRSPLVDFSEVNRLNFINTADTDEWFGHLYHGIILNIWGVDVVRMSDCDFDGDIIMQSPNRIICDSVIEAYPITMNKPKAEPEEMIIDNIIKSDTNSFNNFIGKITNTMTTYITYLANKMNDKYRTSILRKIKLGRYYQGMEIDSSKLGKKERLPRRWNEETKKLPYFLIYKYKHVKARFDKIDRKYRKDAKKKFNMSFNELFSHRDNPQIGAFIKRYFRDIPVIINNAPLNQLCKHIEKYERENFENVYNKEYIDTSDIMTNKEIEVNKENYDRVEQLYLSFMKDYNKAIRKKYLVNEWQSMYSDYQNKALKICGNISELANYCVDITYNKYKTKHKKFAWIIADEGILYNLKLNKNKSIQLPIEMKDDTEDIVEYLGKDFKLYDVDFDEVII